MRLRLAAVLVSAIAMAPVALAQQVERVASTRTPSPVNRDHPAMASGFSPVVAAAMLDAVCAPARDRLEGADKLAASAKLKAAEAPAQIRWALPEGARVWRAESLDSEVFVYAYGPKLTQCGVAIARPLGGAIAAKLREQMADASHGYAVESEQTMQAGVRFTRFKAAGFRYADLMEYASNGEAPGLLKIELLPIS